MEDSIMRMRDTDAPEVGSPPWFEELAAHGVERDAVEKELQRVLSSVGSGNFDPHSVTSVDSEPSLDAGEIAAFGELPIQRGAVWWLLYKSYPDYAVLYCMRHDVLGLDERADQVLLEWTLRQYVSFLRHGSKWQREHVCYSLACDFFEESKLCRFAFAYLVRELARTDWAKVLESCGAVSWELKEPVFVECCADRELHEGIAQGLLGSIPDIDFKAARQIFRRLFLENRALREKVAVCLQNPKDAVGRALN